jgi:hypothetical protein
MTAPAHTCLSDVRSASHSEALDRGENRRPGQVRSCSEIGPAVEKMKGRLMNTFIPSAMLVAVSGIGSGRLVPTVAALVGLIGVVLSGLALARSSGRIGASSGRLGAIAAGVAGLISVVVGGLHAANSAGGFGTGNGLAGAVVAMAVGLISMVLGGLALARSRRRQPDSPPRG